MTILRGYAVLKAFGTGNDNYCIVRVEVDTDMDSTRHWIVEEHDSINIARYWATMLNEGKESEESVRQKIAESREGYRVARAR